ncbi:MAG: hypothetical protein LBS97_04160 [Treponema sp.]|jgi:hypothetical protein|nr:hypothetical protein [Treponema sp.]
MKAVYPFEGVKATGGLQIKKRTAGRIPAVQKGEEDAESQNVQSQHSEETAVIVVA